MIINQLVLCEECRDGSCVRCLRFKRRRARKKRKEKVHAVPKTK